MSQPVKRNAEEAFSDQQAKSQNKRRRRKSQKLADDSENHNINDDHKMPHISTHEPMTESRSSQRSHISDTDNDAGGTVTETLTRKRKRHQRRETQTVVESNPEANLETSPLAEHTSTKASKKDKKRNKIIDSTPGNLSVEGAKYEKSMVHKSKGGARKQVKSLEKETWNLSSRRGGTYINHDPVLTKDNKYIILPTKHDIHVYSTSTSLLVRTINASDRADIQTCTLSAINEHHLYVGTRSGSFTRYDLTTGRKLSQCKIRPGLIYSASAGAEGDCENFFMVVVSDNGSELLQVTIDSKGSEKAVFPILQLDYIHDHVVISQDSSTIVAFGRDAIHIGYAPYSQQNTFIQRSYSWDKFGAKGRIVSGDARITDQPSRAKSYPGVDVAVGLQNGAIFVYGDILNRSQPRSDVVKTNASLARKLHWHRTAARALKWSRDGNYLVSGGDESVLVIWQLDTNQKQFLPHLSTTILNIAISQSGAHYAIRLGDNSVMVLGTADLSPSTNVTGLVVTHDDSYRTTALHPTKPNLLLSAISVRAIGPRATKEATHLQTYDINTNLQIGRQALTRNFITAVNVAPNGQALHEPDVTHLRLTSDGNWLATIDEWCPNAADQESLLLKEDAQAARKESTLRIWAWNSKDNSWLPTIKVDDPHPGSNSSVLALAANPARAEFATIAKDGCVKIWTPKLRMRDGVAIKDNGGGVLYNWSCSCTTQLENTNNSDVQNGCLSYSDDGSVLAACWSSTSKVNYMHLIDTVTGSLALSQPNLVAGRHTQISFCGRFLVVLSDIFTIFDTITLQIVFNLVLNAEHIEGQARTTRLLAVNSSTSTVALGISPVKQQRAKSHINIFDLSTPDFGPKAEISVQGSIQALLAEPAGNGFILLDSEAGLRRLTPLADSVRASSAMTTEDNLIFVTQNQTKGIEGIFAHVSNAQPHQSTDQKLILAGHQSSAQSLDTLLGDNAQGAKLSINDLFEKVAHAVSGVHLAA